jgi:hypothetical protein
MLSGCDTAMFDDADGSVTSAELALLNALAGVLQDPITDGDESFALCLPAGTGVGGAYPLELITAFTARKTPACIRSRRVRGFSIG